ncbi:MAG: hypothetical protein ACO2O2_04285 [Acidilobaceae archaeon]
MYSLPSTPAISMARARLSPVVTAFTLKALDSPGLRITLVKPS